MGRSISGPLGNHRSRGNRDGKNPVYGRIISGQRGHPTIRVGVPRRQRYVLRPRAPTDRPPTSVDEIAIGSGSLEIVHRGKVEAEVGVYNQTSKRSS